MSSHVHFSTIAFVLFLSLLDANCNLLHKLYNNGLAYSDTESESSILTMCKRETSELSLWEQYQCEYIQNRDGVTRCWPQRRMSHCDPGTLKGAIFLYHGFSACPNYYNEFADVLVDDCWHVYQMLIIGHGYNYCHNDTSGSCAKAKYNLTQLPTSRQPYIDYVKMMNNVITHEVSIIKQCELQSNSLYPVDNLQVVVGGLSFGAPLAAASVLLSGQNSVFTKQLIMSPEFIGNVRSFAFNFYDCLVNPNGSFWKCLEDFIVPVLGIDNIFNMESKYVSSINRFFKSLPDIDSDQVYTSYATLMLIVNGMLEWMVEAKPEIQIVSDFLNSYIVWDERPQCESDIKYRDRGGFCVFGMDNFLATISFGKYIMELAAEVDDEIDVETLLIVSQRDGLFWNSFAVNYVRMFYNNDDDLFRNKVNNCMWLIANKCKSHIFSSKIDNMCGVPHSFMSDAGNTGFPPYYLYWRQQKDNGIRSWMDGSDMIDNFRVPINNWDESRNQCVELDVFHPPKQLLFIDNELRDKIFTFYNIDYSTLMDGYFNNSTLIHIDQIISDFIDELDISVNILVLLKIKTQYNYSNFDLNIDNKIMDSIKNNYEFRYWLWKLFDIQINSFHSLPHLLNAIFLKLSGQNVGDKLMKYSNTCEEIGYWYRKSMQVNIDSVHDLSNFLNTITDELLSDNDNDPQDISSVNDYQGIIKQCMRIVQRIKQLKFTKQKKQRTFFGDKDSIIIALSGMNIIVVVTFIVHWLCRRKYSYDNIKN